MKLTRLGGRRGLVVRAVDYRVGDMRFESRRRQFFPQEKSSFNFHVRTNYDAEECRHALVGEV